MCVCVSLCSNTSTRQIVTRAYIQKYICMHNASRQITGKANSHDARREPRIVLLRRFHRDEEEVFGGEDVADVGPDADDPDDELDGADVDEEEKMVDDDA